MATSSAPYKSHIERTADEPRDPGLHKIAIEEVKDANADVRVLKLKPVDGERFQFQPGQWVDLHIPSLPTPGGFTITSPPSSLSSPSPYLELAIQRSPSNPAAAWLFRPNGEIIHRNLQVRIGGSFVWPPKVYGNEGVIKRVVFVAGGVGMNPFVSMLAAIAEGEVAFEVVVLYAAKLPKSGKLQDILWYERVNTIIRGIGGTFKVFLTGGSESFTQREGVEYEMRRMRGADLERLLGEVQERIGTVVYVCGPSAMTDEFVEVAKKAEGIEEMHVLCEKWW